MGSALVGRSDEFGALAVAAKEAAQGRCGCSWCGSARDRRDGAGKSVCGRPHRVRARWACGDGEEADVPVGIVDQLGLVDRADPTSADPTSGGSRCVPRERPGRRDSLSRCGLGAL